MRYAMDVVGKHCSTGAMIVSHTCLLLLLRKQIKPSSSITMNSIASILPSTKKHVLCFFRPGSQHHHHTRVSFLSLPTEPWESPVAIRPPRRWRGCCPNAMAAGWRQRRRWPNTAWRLSHSAEIRCAQHGAHHFSLRKTTGTIWLFNIAMENPHF